MSAPAAGGCSVPEGVSRSSALAFLAHSAHAQGQGIGTERQPAGPPMTTAPETLVPAGVQALLDACLAIYPNQPNPLQVTTRVKYWLGGQDPLDYISMYWNPGNEQLGVPSHWHYISFGLSDLHGDGRVHPRPVPASPIVPSASPPPATASPSGKGIELTFRLAATSPENAPLWPAAMMQALARYIHATGNNIVPGDHIRGVSLGDMNLRHLLAAKDPQLGQIDTAHGTVTFTQLVACTGRELTAAQRGDPHKVLAAMASDTKGCTPHLLSRAPRRSAPLPPAPRVSLPASLAAVTAPILLLTPQDVSMSQDSHASVSASDTAVSLSRTRGPVAHSLEGSTRMSTDSFEMSSIQRALDDLPTLAEESVSLAGVRYLSSAHVVLSREAAAMLPLAIDGRVSAGSHFTWWWRCGVTLVSRCVSHAMCRVAPRHLALSQHWLQIYIPDDLAKDMSQKFAKFSRLADSESSESETEDTVHNESERDNNSSINPNSNSGNGEKDSSIGVSGRSKRDERISLPCSFSWPEYNLTFSIVEDLYPNELNLL